jgi:hypothetical protein
MTDNVIAQHPPAIKVAGRRLSLITKHRPHCPVERSNAEEEKKQENEDYPRPSPDTPIHHEHGHNNYEEEVPHKKERIHHADKKTQEYVQWKSDTNRPSRDHNVVQKAQNTRISQPTGKGFNG